MSTTARKLTQPRRVRQLKRRGIPRPDKAYAVFARINPEEQQLLNTALRAVAAMGGYPTTIRAFVAAAVVARAQQVIAEAEAKGLRSPFGGKAPAKPARAAKRSTRPARKGS